ncbi:bifunctional DNA-formamidopyrimidine glycosylase/DNA-(apurinic or apyrimidinic site) lyase [Sneathiella sp. CAU 1612]|uniref:Formamidopyrimidine-DNA glycosylase n=1 Tax=Sneathiella sedimenti TaxID=2816034 RepID=A0ABS3F2S3_9PROT|nr:bifunctional DNA-formamidopyrimidine glycosylase/DNA-(apurinic or apyrimidinic site) lyase [Sneathiella sedimenti]MBO0332709.1 bifunctional DNA-formamidopyrimidine glycosylase/DNA-(apurinic or apyrimidinic site) lyase [Sneathiella sedimenti]
MPELPEVETVCRGLEQALIGDQFTTVTLRRENLRFPFADGFAETLTGRRIEAIRRRAKYILMSLEGGDVMIGHLGMSGSFRIEPDPDPMRPFDKHDHVIFETARGLRVRYHDPRRFGFMLLTRAEVLDSHPQLAGIGPEPLGNEFNGPVLAERLAGRKTPIKIALLDQRVVAGVGNIYACEALHRSGISPKRQAANVKGRRADLLAAAIRTVLEEAIASGGSTLRNYSHTDGELGYFQHRFLAYDKENAPCPTVGCTGIIRRITQSGRSTFYCPKCQR